MVGTKQLRKVTLEYDDMKLTADGEEALAYQENLRRMTEICLLHNMNFFAMRPIRYQTTTEGFIPTPKAPTQGTVVPNLIGDVKFDVPPDVMSQPIVNDFMTELEAVMEKYRVSKVDVCWSRFTGKMI